LAEYSVDDARFIVTGPTSLPSSFRVGTARMWGIGLLPLGWARFMDVPAGDLANVGGNGERHPAFTKFSGLCEVLCDASVSKEQQFDALTEFMRGVMRPNRDEPKIMRVHKALLDSKLTSVAEFASEVAMSTRTLERVCMRYFGFPPKLLMRRQRFMRSLTSFMLHQGANWTEAMDEHYHDQAHFSREFREFMTMNPTEYAALDHPILASFMEARARIWGSAAQTLDTPER
ncbi:MAG: helix-turn-helix domain-containing protein, partial [Marinomonas sp.]